MSARFRDLARLVAVTSNPPSPAAGDTWYDGPRGQVRGSDGAAGEPTVIGPFGNVPVVRNAGWHGLPAGGGPSTMVPTLGRAYALPMWPGRACTMTHIAVEVTAAAVGNIRAALYTDTGAGVPDALVADYGQIATGLIGVKTWTLAPVQPLRPVLYWLVIVQQGLLAVGLRSRDTWEPMVSETAAVLSGSRNAYYVDGVGGAAPGTFPAIAGTVQGPAAQVRLTT